MHIWSVTRVLSEFGDGTQNTYTARIPLVEMSWELVSEPPETGLRTTLGSVVKTRVAVHQISYSSGHRELYKRSLLPR